mgnify:CR=1 FL=1
MEITIKEVRTAKELRDFIRFPYSLYKDNPNWVPPLFSDEWEVFNPKKNPALAHCQTKKWLALRGGVIVGRVAGIIHQKEATDKQLARFGWIDFIDDPAVARLLVDHVEAWAKAEGMKGVHGPLGFSDMDPEGMLVEGFDTPGTIATVYNHAYYPQYIESMGYAKAADWIEGRGEIPAEPSKRLIRTAEIVEGRFKLKSLKLTSRKQVAARGRELFTVLNSAYRDLYGFQSLTEGQINYYIKMYLGFVIPELVSMVVNDKDELVGFGVAMPSLTNAFQKAKGNLIPFGLFHILKALKTEKTVDLYLIGVLPEYQRMGVTALIFRDLILAFNKRGFTRARTNIILEDNISTLTQFTEYQQKGEMHKRRRCYIKQF